MTVKPWLEVDRQTLHRCRVFDVVRSVSQSPIDASTHEFFRLHAPDWAQIVPVTPERDVVLIRQYRHGSQRISLEIPAGHVDPGESPDAAAARECLEETGYRVATVESLGVTNPNPALFDNRLHSFCALDVRRVAEIGNTTTEQTEVELVPMTKLPELLDTQIIDHALDAMTLWQFLHRYGC
jgi:ADP-ribose pyrophosphatase